MSEEDSGLLVPNQLVGNDQPVEGVIHCGLGGDDSKKVVEFPKAEVPPEERARRLKVEVERLASLPRVEWMLYVESDGVAEKHGISRTVMKEMIEATIKEREKKAHEDRAENHRSEQRADLPPSAFVTTLQAAAYIGSTPAVLFNWRSQRRGPRYHGSNDFIRYRIADLDMWMSSRADEIRPPPVDLEPTTDRNIKASTGRQRSRERA